MIKLLKGSAYLILGAVIAIVLFGVFFNTAQIASASMEPTLMTGDLVLFRRAFTGKPSYGSIIEFHHGDKIYSKRVIGMPGDTVSFLDGNVYLNGKILNEEYLPQDLDSTKSPNFSEITVPADSLFVLGDNRNHSYDSRYWESPFVNTSDIIGYYVMTFLRY